MGLPGQSCSQSYVLLTFCNLSFMHHAQPLRCPCLKSDHSVSLRVPHVIAIFCMPAMLTAARSCFTASNKASVGPSSVPPLGRGLEQGANFPMLPHLQTPVCLQEGTCMRSCHQQQLMQVSEALTACQEDSGPPLRCLERATFMLQAWQ